jgi:hypothetical protein
VVDVVAQTEGERGEVVQIGAEGRRGTAQMRRRSRDDEQEGIWGNFAHGRSEARDGEFGGARR